MAHFVDRGPESERNALLGKNITSQETGEISSLVPPFRSSRKVAYTLTVIAVVLWLLFELRHHSGASIDPASEVLHGSPSCKQAPCFSPAKIQVESRASFPSFLDYANKGAIHVSYDSRSIFINDERVLLLGGSLHPSRATKETWDHALDEVVRNGLNFNQFQRKTSTGVFQKVFSFVMTAASRRQLTGVLHPPFDLPQEGGSSSTFESALMIAPSTPMEAYQNTYHYNIQI
jgi:hypothetical protein